MNLHRGHASLALGLAFGLVACGGAVASTDDGSGNRTGTSSSSSGGASDTGNASGGNKDEEPSGTTTNIVCTRPLDTFVCKSTAPGSYTWCCPATFDGAAASLPSCGLGESQSYAACPGAKVLTRSFGTHAIQCFYGPGDDTLVRASMQDDVPDFCDNISSVVEGGGPVSPQCLPDSMEQATCPHVDPTADAGVDGG